jgi:hypothetical protein
VRLLQPHSSGWCCSPLAAKKTPALIPDASTVVFVQMVPAFVHPIIRASTANSIPMAAKNYNARTMLHALMACANAHPALVVLPAISFTEIPI